MTSGWVGLYGRPRSFLGEIVDLTFTEESDTSDTTATSDTSDTTATTATNFVSRV